MFEKIVNFLKSAVDGVVGFMKQPIPNAIWHAALGGAAGFATTNGLHLDHAGLAGLGMGALGGVIGWARGSGSPTANEIADAVEKALVARATALPPPVNPTVPVKL